jgi:hypothetical protein
MAINRFDNPIQFQYNSQFVPTQLPWDLLQKQGERKQAVEDTGKLNEAKLGDLQVTGREYFTDNEGRVIAAPDRQMSSQVVDSFGKKLNEFSKKYSNQERGTADYAYGFSELQQEYNKAKALNDKINLRSTTYDEMMKERQSKKINFGDHVGVDFNDQVYRMVDPETGIDYIPENIAYQDQINRVERGNTIMSGIKDEVQNWFSGATGDGYIKSYKEYGILPSKVYDTFSPGFMADKELQQDIDLEIKHRAGLEGKSPNELVDYEVADERNPSVKTTIQIPFAEAVRRDAFNEMLGNAMKFVHSDKSGSTAGDSTFWKNKEEKKTLQAKLPLVAEGLDVDSRSDWERTIDNETKSLGIEKAKTTLNTLSAQIAGIEASGVNVNNIANYRDLKAQQQAHLTSIAEYDRNYSTIGAELLPEAKNLLLSGLKRDLQEAESQAAINSKRSVNPLAVKGGSSTANIETPQSKAVQDKINKIKNSISLVENQNFTNFESVKNKLQGTEAGLQFDNMINNRMAEIPSDQEFNSFIYTGKDNKDLVSQVQNYLLSAPYDFVNENGDNVSFDKFSSFDNNFAVDVKDGKLYIAVTGTDSRWQDAKERVSETIEISPDNKIFRQLLEKTRDDANEAALGGNEQAALVYDEINNSLFMTEPATSLNASSIQNLDKKAGALPKAGSSMLFNLTNPDDVSRPIRGIATKNNTGQYDVYFSFYDYEDKKYKTIDPAVITDGQTNFNSVSGAIKTSGIIKQR